jgi:hypothetical protein
MRVKPDSLLTEQIPDHRERRDAHDDVAADPVSLQNVILECDAFRIVLVQPRLGDFLAREDFKVIDVADFLAGIDVNPDAHWSLLKLASGPVLNQIAHQPISLD